MARTDAFTGLSEFLAVAEESSFRLAAARLNVTPAAVSQAIRALEDRLGLPLFQRTTRRVGLTEAGSALFARLRPAASEIGDAFEALGTLRSRPAGQLKLSVPRLAVELIIEPVLPEFRRSYPDVNVEVDVNDAAVDLTENGLDAGIRIGETLEKDMIAVRITPDIRWSIVGSPAYFTNHARPRAPEDLASHECIRYRFASRSVYRWEFEREGREFSVDPPGSVTVNDGTLLVALAKRGMGLAYTADLFVNDAVAAGELEHVLTPFLPVTPGLFLYFPARTQTQPKLRAFIDMLTAFAKRKARGTKIAAEAPV